MRGELSSPDGLFFGYIYTGAVSVALSGTTLVRMRGCFGDFKGNIVCFYIEAYFAKVM